MLNFIDVIDMTTAKDDGQNRKVSFAIGGKKAIPNTLNLLGGLKHNSVITFDKDNAKKMRDFCQSILDKDVK